MIREERVEKAVAWCVLGLSVVVGLVLRWNWLGRDSLWYDEVNTMEMARSAWRELLSVSLRGDTAPPLYMVLAKMWISLFGTTEIALRSFSALIGSVALFAAYRMGLVYGGRQAAVFATALMAFHHFALYYSQEFRSYILLLTMTTASLAVSGRWICRRTRTSRDTIQLGVVQTILLFTHFYSFLVVIFENLAYLLNQGERDEESDRTWFTSQAWAFAAFAFWLPATAYQAFHLPQSHLGAHVDFQLLLVKLTPVGGVEDLGNPISPLYLLPLLFAVLFSRALGVGWARGWSWVGRSGVRSGLLRTLAIYCAAGALLIPVARLYLTAWPNAPVPADRLLWQGFVLHAVAFGSLFVAAAAAGLVARKSTEDPVTGGAALVFGWLPIFAVVGAELTCRWLRPVFELRNFIILVPSTVGALAVVFGRIRGSKLRTAVAVALFLGLVSQMAEFVHFRYRIDYRWVARQIVNKTEELKVQPVVATISPEGTLLARYYFPNLEVRPCQAPCAELKKEPFVVWFFHTFDLANERSSVEAVKQRIREGKYLFDAQKPGLAGVLISYEKR